MIIDRFEEDFAVIIADDKTIFNIPRSALLPDVKEGDVIKIVVDEKKTEEKKEALKEKMNSLFSD